MKREDFCWTKFSYENATTISRIEAIRKIIDQEVELESCQAGIAEIEKDMMICIMTIWTANFSIGNFMILL